MGLPANILVIRNDKLGDFMLAWPAFNVIRKSFPDAKIYALVPEYTQPLAELCPWIDEIIIDSGISSIASVITMSRTLRSLNIDAAICFYSRPRIASALVLAGIKHRFGPASRIDQLFYNHRLTQRRSKSEKPEFQYNIDLANYMISAYGLVPLPADKPPYLHIDELTRDSLRQIFLSEHSVAEDDKLVFVHSGSGGSAVNLSTSQYSNIIHYLAKDNKLFFVLTAGPEEYSQAKLLSDHLKGIRHTILHSKKGLKAFTEMLSIANFLICGSTGVLHIAGALNIPTAAFYPARRSATALRWQTLNSDDRRLAFSGDSDDMKDIDTSNVGIEIIKMLN